MILFIKYVLLLCILKSAFCNTEKRVKRIVNGRIVEEAYAPFMAAVKYKNSLVCGATIISSTKVLSGAGCILSECANQPLDRCIKQVTVVVGSNKLSSGGTAYNVTSIKVPDDYRQSDFQNNFAVITLDSEIYCSKHVMPIHLPNKDVVENSTAYVFGWGDTSPTLFSTNSDDLLVLKLKVLMNTECREVFHDMHPNDFCAVSDIKDGGLCGGDSGGPLIQNGKLLGVLSYGKGKFCSDGGTNFFVNVFRNLNFIQREIETNIPTTYFEPERIWIN